MFNSHRVIKTILLMFTSLLIASIDPPVIRADQTNNNNNNNANLNTSLPWDQKPLPSYNRTWYGVNRAIVFYPIKTTTNQNPKPITLQPQKHPQFQMVAMHYLSKLGKYHIVDYTIKYHDQIGHTTASSQDVIEAYYNVDDFTHLIHKIKIIHQIKGHGKFKTHAKNTILTVKKVVRDANVHYHGVNVFELSDGSYVTANKYFVQVIK